MNEPWTSDGASQGTSHVNDRAKPTRSIAPRPSPNAPQFTIVGLGGETRHTIGLAVARSVGRPFTASRLRATNDADRRDPVDDEISSACRALGGESRVVFACGVDVFDAEPLDGLDDSNGDERRVDGSRSDITREATELLTAAWIVWIDRRSDTGDQAGTGAGIEVERLRNEAQRRRAVRWADRRVDATDLSPDELVDAVLEGWTACPSR